MSNLRKLLAIGVAAAAVLLDAAPTAAATYITPNFSGPTTGACGITAADRLCLDLSQTLNSSGIVLGGLRINVTDTASNAAAKLFTIRVGGADKFTIDKAGKVASGQITIASGDVLTSGNIRAGTGSAIYFSGRLNMFSTADGVLSLQNNAGTQSATITVGAANLLTLNGGLTTGGILNVPVGSAAAPSVTIGNATTGFYSVSTTGLGTSVNGVLKLDYGITNSGAWSVPGAFYAGAGAATGIELAGSGSNPSVIAIGSGSNVNMQVTGKGTGYTAIQSEEGAVTNTRFLDVSSGVNFFDQYGGAAGTGVTLESKGTDTDVNMTLKQRGAGKLVSTGPLMVGSATPLAVTGGGIAMAKMTASAAAPGAAGGKIELVCGTNAGSAKLVAYAGTSGTAVTILDNIGAGVTGC